MANIVSPFEDPERRLAAGRFGMLIFIASLAMIFAAAILGFLVVRLEDDGSWPPPGMPALPWSLLLSTLILVASSVTFLRATGDLRRDDERGLVRWLTGTLVLALAFLAVQTFAWWDLIGRGMDFSRHLYAWTFYFLTGLHAVHVLGGVIPLWIVTRRVRRGDRSPSVRRGIFYTAMYWHFLDVAWVVLYLTLVAGTLGG
ncbi:MAG: heme-copper oxidase subunit III [Phycisphaeraceae bacterium]|nr:heme-copper oxidase subunit III [Phycisphaeraceae bacterium]|tara:strand:- start:663 stop:1262 length:600 start_codon:yes stop_codon:yes gene_type:complete